MKILRVDMSSLETSSTDVPAEYELLGGRGLTSRLLFEEVEPRCHALGAGNKLVIAPGFLTGSAMPCSGRTSFGAKSPLTGTIKESNVGGRAGQYLAGYGIKALVVEGKPADDTWRVLIITKDGMRLEEKPGLVGKGNYETMAILGKEYGEKNAIMSIGPAGEKKASLATVAINDLEGRPTRHAGRGGIGAVMGSKGLKAIVVSPPSQPVVPAFDAATFKMQVKEFAANMRSSKKALSKYGTALLVNIINGAGGLPTRNFSTGTNENAEEISGEKLYQLCAERGGRTAHACSRGCVIRCSNIFHDADGNYVTAGFEYETIGLLGSNCGLNNLDDIAKLDYLCDDLGIDTMEMGVALGVAMEGGFMPFGDFSRMKESIEQVATGTLTGKMFGQGAALTGRVLGVERVPVVKGQAMAAYDPRAIKGNAVTYASSPMGADHTAGNCLPGRGGLDSHKAVGHIALSRTTQILSTLYDTLGRYVFVGPVPEMLPAITDLAASFSGLSLTEEMLLEKAKETLRLEILFNKKAGIGKEQDDLPLFFRQEPLPESGLVFDVPAEEIAAIEF